MENFKKYQLIPSAGASFSYAWSKIFGKAFIMLLATVIIAGLLQAPMGGINWKMSDDHFSWPILILFPIAMFGLAYAFLLVPVFKYGVQYVFLKAMRDEEADLKYLFEGFKRQYLNIVLSNLVVSALVMIGTVMLVVPGIIIWCRLAFVPYLVMDKNMDAMKALEKSWQMTSGHGWTIFVMTLISILVFIGGLIFCFVGSILSMIWIHGAFATLYYAVDDDTPEDTENPIPILGVNEV